MNDSRSSLPPDGRRSSTRRGLGCGLIAGVLLLGLVALSLRLGPDLLARVTGPAAPPSLPIQDRTSPEQLAELRARQVERLNSTGWISQEAGLVHIPIATAIALVAQEGLPIAAHEAAQEAAQEEEQAEAPDVAPASETPAAEGASLPSQPDVALSQVTYQEHVLPIFETYCGECHGAEDPEENLELTRYRTALVGSQNGPVIEPGDPENSYLVEQIVEGRMPKDADPLSPANIEIIIAWIAAGAPE